MGLDILAADDAEERWDSGNSGAEHRALVMGVDSYPLGLRTDCVLGHH